MKRLKNLLIAAYDFVDSYLYDIWRYWHHSQAFARFRSRITARAYLLMTTHALEKGLAFQERKPGFGKSKCGELLEDAMRFQEQFGPDPVCRYVIEVVGSVLEFHATTGNCGGHLQSRTPSWSSLSWWAGACERNSSLRHLRGFQWMK